jgi:hypothetical protein
MRSSMQSGQPPHSLMLGQAPSESLPRNINSEPQQRPYGGTR